MFTYLEILLPYISLCFSSRYAVYVNLPVSGSTGRCHHAQHSIKFATKVTRSSPCVGAARPASGGITPIQPQDVHLWAVTRAGTANDPRADFGERSDLPSGTFTSQTVCFPAGMPSFARSMPTSIPIPIPEEGGELLLDCSSK